MRSTSKKRLRTTPDSKWTERRPSVRPRNATACAATLTCWDLAWIYRQLGERQAMRASALMGRYHDLRGCPTGAAAKGVHDYLRCRALDAAPVARDWADRLKEGVRRTLL